MAIGAIAVGGMVAGTLLNAYSQYSSYQEQKATSKYNQAIIDANNRIDQALIDMDIRRIKEEGEELLGSQRAAMGASGTKFSGSNLEVFMGTVKDIQMDVITMNIQKMVKSASANQQKLLLSMQQKSASNALPFQIASSLIGGATNIAQSQAGGTR